MKNRKNQLELAIEWEVAPYLNEIEDGVAHSLPPIHEMVKEVNYGLINYNYEEGRKIPIQPTLHPYTYDEIYNAIAESYYPHLAKQSFPTVYVYWDGELYDRYENFDDAIVGLSKLSWSEYLVTINNIPYFVDDSILFLMSMKRSGHYD